MNRNTRRLALVVLLLLAVILFAACQRERPSRSAGGLDDARSRVGGVA